MPAITLDLADAAELAETLTLLTQWLSGNQEQTLAESFAAFIGHPAYNTGTLCADLHRFAFLLGASDGEEPSASRHHDRHDRANAPSS